MHLTPEQVDRQPFRMRKRGYDIGQVREFLREVAAQMRADASTDDSPEEILALARAEAAQIIVDAERAARRRSDEVVRDTQARLDRLLDEERTIRERMASAERVAPSVASSTAVPDLREAAGGATDPQAQVIDLPPGGKRDGATPDHSLADFMKSALRDEIV